MIEPDGVCVRCGSDFIKNSNAQKYCNDCSPSGNTKLKMRTIYSQNDIPDRPPDSWTTTPMGYIMLYWKVGHYDYVKCFEHRMVAGFPHHSLHVHHVNGDKADNRPENLQVLTPKEHGNITFSESRGFDYDRAKELYEQGYSTPKIAKMLGSTKGAVYHALKKSGATTRSISESWRYRK